MPGSTTHTHEEAGSGRLNRKLLLSVAAVTTAVGISAAPASASKHPCPGHVIEYAKKAV